jgi:hypothetical protein
MAGNSSMEDLLRDSRTRSLIIGHSSINRRFLGKEDGFAKPLRIEGTLVVFLGIVGLSPHRL